MPDLSLPVLPDPLDLFDRPHAADPSPRAAALLAPLPVLDAGLSPELLAEARPGYGDPPPPFYASPDSRLRLYQADALELLRRMRDESVDMVFADPPYFLSNGGITCVGGRMVRVDLALDWEVPIFTGNTDFRKMSSVGSDDRKAINPSNYRDAAVLRASAFDGSGKVTENLGGFIVIAQDGSAVQFTHKV